MADRQYTGGVVVLQYNYPTGGQVVEAVLETAVKMEADLVLI
jgi:endonuclease/exonuclease/phosphatase (EEP) superfamily protein YafD